jgi:DNA primase
VVSRISKRLGSKEETIWDRLQELRAVKRPERDPAITKTEHDPNAAQAKVTADPLELDLLRILLADPALVQVARAEVELGTIEHPRLRLLLEVLYRLQAEGEVPDLDHLRLRIDNPALVAKALELQEHGRSNANRPEWLRQVLARFRERSELPLRIEIQNQLRAVSEGDDATALELLRQVQGGGRRTDCGTRPAKDG